MITRVVGNDGDDDGDGDGDGDGNTVASVASMGLAFEARVGFTDFFVRTTRNTPDSVGLVSYRNEEMNK